MSVFSYSPLRVLCCICIISFTSPAVFAMRIAVDPKKKPSANILYPKSIPFNFFGQLFQIIRDDGRLFVCSNATFIRCRSGGYMCFGMKAKAEESNIALCGHSFSSPMICITAHTISVLFWKSFGHLCAPQSCIHTICSMYADESFLQLMWIEIRFSIWPLFLVIFSLPRAHVPKYIFWRENCFVAQPISLPSSAHVQHMYVCILTYSPFNGQFKRKENHWSRCHDTHRKDDSVDHTAEHDHQLKTILRNWWLAVYRLGCSLFKQD